MKKMEYMILFAFLLLLGACGEDRNDRIAEDQEMLTEDDWDADEAMTDWTAAWNENDARSLEATTSEDLTLLFAGKAYEKDSASIWINNSSSWMKDLRRESLMKNKSGNLAYESGTFTHATTENDTVQYSGTYTIIWERSGDGGAMTSTDGMETTSNTMEDTTGQAEGNARMGDSDWKIKVMHITPDMASDTMSVDLGQMPRQ